MTGGGHNFVDIYEAYISNLRNQPITLLEIGLGATGASMKMWHDYFPSARLFGIDLNSHSNLDNDRITTFIADQGDKQQLSSFIESVRDIEFDIIIDDGSHKPVDQQQSFSIFFPKLKKGGLYFIEDLLPNGLGDNWEGAMSSDRVINTRSLFRKFSKTSSFEIPNALGDTSCLKNEIDSVSFHAPRVSFSFIFSFNSPYFIKKRIRFIPESENLLAVRKKK